MDDPTSIFYNPYPHPIIVLLPFCSFIYVSDFLWKLSMNADFYTCSYHCPIVKVVFVPL